MRNMLLVFYSFFGSLLAAQDTIPFVIVGGGASGIAAGLQAAEMGTETHIFEPTTWLGGMLTSAGVSAFDGNHRIAGGIFATFRDSLYAHYGGPKAVETGWVSNTLFEPHVGNTILKNMATELSNLHIHYEYQLEHIYKDKGYWYLRFSNEKGDSVEVLANIVLDATELGDVVRLLQLPADIGMDARRQSGEELAPAHANDIVQDLTWVAILKDYGSGADRTIPKPKGYSPEAFSCACKVDKDLDKSGIDCQTMLNYGRLPNDKYMLNWPTCGNDFYLNVLNLNPTQRSKHLEAAREHTLCFVYYIQHELGYKHLGLAEDEFPSGDGLALIPYYRESRRIHGKVRLTLQQVQQPYQGIPLYRTSIASGDYPIDHHHKKNAEAPEIDFINMKVPAYTVPLGALLPRETSNFIVAEKSISVSNIVNGASRLQPVVLGIGQAAGVLAALAFKQNKPVEKIPIRQVQQTLLDHTCRLMPFLDVDPAHPYFQHIQRIALCGILKGSGIPYKWANQMWFYPKKTISQFDLVEGLRPWYPVLGDYWSADGSDVDGLFLKILFSLIQPTLSETAINAVLKDINVGNSPLNRAELAYTLDVLLNPFARPVYWNGFPLSHTQN